MPELINILLVEFCIDPLISSGSVRNLFFSARVAIIYPRRPSYMPL